MSDQPQHEANRNPHHLTRRQVCLAFGLMAAVVTLGYLIIEWSLRKARRKRGKSMWDTTPPPAGRAR